MNWRRGKSGASGYLSICMVRKTLKYQKMHNLYWGRNMDGVEIYREENVSAIRESLAATIKAVTRVSSKIIITELEQLLMSPEIIKNAPNGIMTYVYAAGFLSFSGREINKKNMHSVVSALGIEPNERLIGVILSPELNIKSHLIYVYGFYFLLVNGVIPTEDDIIKIVSSVGEKGDRQTASEVCDFISVSNIK